MKVFIDGSAGTTGLQLEERLLKRSDVELLKIDRADAKNENIKIDVMKQVDAIFLCLPDDAARRSAEIAPTDTVVIDASTAHRTAAGWTYGLPELSERHRSEIAGAKRIAAPGCHACGFISLVYPLMSAGLLPQDAQINCTSVTGYSGGGKSLISTYETERTPEDNLHAPMPYALGLTHKHLPEMTAVTGLRHPPHFYPIVGDMAQGMLVSVHLWQSQFTKKTSPEAVHELISAHYTGSFFIRVQDLEGVSPYAPPQNFLDPTACNGTNFMDIFVFGHENQLIVSARFDNLGKGASGAAMQCMNIAAGLDERTGFE